MDVLAARPPHKTRTRSSSMPDAVRLSVRSLLRVSVCQSFCQFAPMDRMLEPCPRLHYRLLTLCPAAY